MSTHTTSNSNVFSGKLRLFLIAVMSFMVVAVTAPVLSAEEGGVYLVEYVKFKPGKGPEALRIIHERFHAVDKRIGRRVLPFDYMTGDWDHIVYFPYDPARMDTIPSRDEWMKALAAQEGGMDQALALWQEFLKLVKVTKTEIARLPASFAP